jgi:hypothetical protein
LAEHVLVQQRALDDNGRLLCEEGRQGEVIVTKRADAIGFQRDRAQHAPLRCQGDGQLCDRPGTERHIQRLVGNVAHEAWRARLDDAADYPVRLRNMQVGREPPHRVGTDH